MRSARLSRIEADGVIEVVLDAQPACERCAKGRGCGIAFTAPAAAVSLSCAAPDGRTLTQRDIGCPVQVEFDTPDAAWLLPFALACALPTLGLVGGTLLGDASGGLAGLAGGLLSWFGVSPRLERWLAQRPCIGQARIARVDPPRQSHASAHPQRDRC